MNLRRLTILLAATVSLAAPQTPTFEVASVKPHPMPAGRFVMRMYGGQTILRSQGARFTEDTATLQDLIMDAYGVKAYQIVGMADWAKSPRGEYYDIAAISSVKSPSSVELQLMLRALLADRFKLTLHREMKELPVYALVVGKNGPKLRELSDAEKDAIRAARGSPGPARGPQSTPAPVMTTTISMLMRLLSNTVDRPLIDETGLTGTYEFANLDWVRLAQERREPGSGESVFGAVQDQLGLRLQPRKDSVEVLVIDRADKPSAN